MMIIMMVISMLLRMMKMTMRMTMMMIMMTMMTVYRHDTGNAFLSEEVFSPIGHQAGVPNLN